MTSTETDTLAEALAEAQAEETEASAALASAKEAYRVARAAKDTKAMAASRILMQTCEELLADSQGKVAEATAPIAARNRAAASESFLDRAAALAKEMLKEHDKVLRARAKMAASIESCGAQIREGRAMRDVRRQELMNYQRQYDGALSYDLEERGVPFDHRILNEKYGRQRFEEWAAPDLGVLANDGDRPLGKVVDALAQTRTERGHRTVHGGGVTI